jgi:hypothetical protein
MADLRGMIASEGQTSQAQQTTSETVEHQGETQETTDNTQQATTETAETKPEATTQEKEEELPENVKKRITKEVERTTSIQRKIDEAVSARKAKEKELEQLGAADTGSQPEKKPAQTAAAQQPKRPVFGEAGHEKENWDQFEARQAKYDGDIIEFVKQDTLRQFNENQAQQTQQRARQEKWDAAVKEHGKEFPALMETVQAHSGEGLQLAISQMEGWSKVAVHLAKNPAQLEQLNTEFSTNPYEVIAKLGRIRDAITVDPKTKATTAAATKPLPEPLAKVGGNASVGGMDLQQTLEKGNWSQIRAAAAKVRGK